MRGWRRVAAPTALVLAMVLSASGCGRGVDAGTDDESRIRVWAAASLTDAFADLATAFEAEAANPGVAVELNFGASSSLREQILAGAPGDVFAAADRSNMVAVVAAGAAVDPVDFATNQLQIAVPAGNPAGVRGPAAFADADLLVGLCSQEVPCGRFGRQVLAQAGIAPSIDTNEPNVAALMTKIEAGELDVGIVYRSDVIAAGGAVEGIAIPDHAEVTATYPIAALAGAANPEGATAFVAFVLSDEGQAILASSGFGAP